VLDDADEPELHDGWVDHAVAAEFPELRLRWMQVPAPPGHRSPEELRARLRQLSGRFAGAQAIGLRREPIPHAYRVFFRAIGLDPDTTRTPIEAAVVQRLFDGGFVSQGHLEDALRIALVETSIPLWAVDPGRLDGPLGIRLSRAGERLGSGPYADELPAGRLVVADAGSPVGVLFGDLAAPALPTAESQELRNFTVRVAGVPEIHVEEALWLCAEALDLPADGR
jgi:DNA/RNA-binding domain of Phe-tRNA-synthetase-like protein